MITTDYLSEINETYNEKYVDEVPMGGMHPHMVEYIYQTAGVLRAPTNFAFGAVNTVFGAALGRKVTIIDGEYKNRCPLYSSIVGGASSAKSPTIDTVMKPLNRIDKKRNDDFDKNYNIAKQEDSELPINKGQLVASNETIENLYRVLNNVKNSRDGLLMHQDELLNFFGKNATKYSDGNIISDFLTLFGGFSPLRVGRVRMEKPIYVPEPVLAILGGTQKKRVDELFIGQEHNGFQSRWTFWLPNVEAEFIEHADEVHEQRWADLIGYAVSPELEDINLRFENQRQLWEFDDNLRKYRDYFEKMDEDNLAETIMKQGYVVRRLAGIFHCMNSMAEGYQPKEVIKSETLEYAIEVVKHLFRNAGIIDRVINEKRKRKITGKQAIQALQEEYGIANQSMFAKCLQKGPNQQYISRCISEMKKK